MTANRDLAALAGRILLTLIFITSGFGKIGGFEGTAAYIASKGLPLPQLGAAIAIAVELGGGLLVLVGWKARWAALALAVFTLATAVFFHPYWTVAADKRMADYLSFWKNLAIAGGFLTVYAFGPGRFSVDRS